MPDDFPQQLWDTVRVNVLSFCFCAWIYQMKTFSRKGHTGNGLATISCQGGHGPVCANVVVPSNPIQHWGHIPLSIVFLCLRDYLLCQKIPAFCVLMRTQWGVFRGRQPWVAQSFGKRKLDTESQLIANGNIRRHSEWRKGETEHSNNSKLDQPE